MRSTCVTARARCPARPLIRKSGRLLGSDHRAATAGSAKSRAVTSATRRYEVPNIALSCVVTESVIRIEAPRWRKTRPTMAGSCDE